MEIAPEGHESGDWELLKARYEQIWVRLLLSEGGPQADRTAVEEHICRAARAEKKALDIQGVDQSSANRGMDDLRWDRLVYWFLCQPPGWQRDAQRAIAELLENNRKLQFTPGQIAALTYQGRLQVLQSHTQEAMESLQAAVDLSETLIREMDVTGPGGANIRNTYHSAYDLLAKLQIQAGRLESAFATLGRLQQLDSLNSASPGFSGNSRLKKIANLRGEVKGLRAKLSARQSAGTDVKPIEHLLADSKSSFYSTLTQLRRSEPQYEKMLAIRPVNFSKLQAFIPSDTVVVQYFPADDGLYLFVATSTTLKIRKVEVSATVLQQAVLDFRKAAVSDFISALGGSTGTAISWKEDGSVYYHQTIAPLKLVLFRLHAWLIEPIEADLAGKKVVAFIPTGMLDYLPLQALARPTAEGGAEFLIERKQCVTLLKSSDLDQLARPAASGTGGLLALADPDGSLPAADAEVAAITRGFPASQSFVREQASRDKLTSMPAGLSYLHLATHGSLDPRDPNSSYLLLAGNQEQSRLSVAQIYDLKLKGTRLVTLSACQTALGESDPGSELTTLADAFSVAGTSSVVASLWSVSDASTAQLMTEFYSQLKAGGSLAGSLQAAQIKLIRNPATNHPFYWAPFELIGDWR